MKISILSVRGRLRDVKVRSVLYTRNAHAGSRGGDGSGNRLEQVWWGCIGRSDGQRPRRRAMLVVRPEDCSISIAEKAVGVSLR
jgi:hypothetical protein